MYFDISHSILVDFPF